MWQTRVRWSLSVRQNYRNFFIFSSISFDRFSKKKKLLNDVLFLTRKTARNHEKWQMFASIESINSVDDEKLWGDIQLVSDKILVFMIDGSFFLFKKFTKRYCTHSFTRNNNKQSKIFECGIVRFMRTIFFLKICLFCIITFTGWLSWSVENNEFTSIKRHTSSSVTLMETPKKTLRNANRLTERRDWKKKTISYL